MDEWREYGSDVDGFDELVILVVDSVEAREVGVLSGLGPAEDDVVDGLDECLLRVPLAEDECALVSLVLRNRLNDKQRGRTSMGKSSATSDTKRHALACRLGGKWCEFTASNSRSDR